MSKKTLIIVIAAVLVIVLGAVALFAVPSIKNDDENKDNPSSIVSGSEQVVEGGKVEIETIEAATADDKIELEIKIAENPGFAGYELEFTFDSAALEFVECKNALLAPLNAELTDSSTLAVIGVENGDVKDNGTLFTLVFKPTKNAKAGEYVIKTTKTDFANWDEVTVKPNIAEGKILIK